MILIKKSKFGIACIDLTNAYAIEVSRRILRILYDSDFVYMIELETELSDEQREQLAYYLSVMKNTEEVTSFEKLLKTIGDKDD